MSRIEQNSFYLITHLFIYIHLFIHLFLKGGKAEMSL